MLLSYKIKTQAPCIRCFFVFFALIRHLKVKSAWKHLKLLFHCYTINLFLLRKLGKRRINRNISRVCIFLSETVTQDDNSLILFLGGGESHE